MTVCCPTCGRPLPPGPTPSIQSADALVATLAITGGDRRTRDVYEGYHNGKIPTERFYVTYSGGTVARQAVDEARARGLIVPSWPGIEAGSWSLPDKAADNRKRYVEMEARAATRKKSR